PPRLRSHATPGPIHLGTTGRPPDRARRPPPRRGGRRDPPRHQRRVRPRNGQRPHPRSAPPYPADLTIATKVGVDRAPDRSFVSAATPERLAAQIHQNLATLGLDRLPLVYLRLG